MARTTIAPATMPGGSYGVGFNEFEWTAADVGNGNQFLSTGKEILLVRNVNADSPPVSRIVTLHKTSGSVEKTVAAGEYWASGVIPTTGWKQTDTYVYVNGAHANLEFAVIKEP